MKLKLGSAHLICIILVQLVLIDVFLILFFFKKINEKSASDSEIRTEVSAAHSKGEDNKGINNSRNIKSKDTDIKKNENFSVLKDFFATFGLDKPMVRDFRIIAKNNNYLSFIATAYDLSYESCGKYPSHPEYGITFSGKPAIKGRTVAVDPEVIPLGSRLYIEFPREYAQMNGWYVAEDTGSKVKGNIVDIFFGKSATPEAKKFGRKRVKVQVIPPNGNIG